MFVLRDTFHGHPLVRFVLFIPHRVIRSCCNEVPGQKRSSDGSFHQDLCEKILKTRREPRWQTYNIIFTYFFFSRLFILFYFFFGREDGPVLFFFSFNSVWCESVHLFHKPFLLISFHFFFFTLRFRVYFFSIYPFQYLLLLFSFYLFSLKIFFSHQ